MARTLAVYIAMFLLSMNLGFTIVNLIDEYMISSLGHSIFQASRIEPYETYGSFHDYTDNETNLTNVYDVKNTVDREIDYGPQEGIADSTDYWAITKSSLVTIVNLLFGGFIGLPLFVYHIVGVGIFTVLSPIFIVMGIIQILGIYEIIRGTSL